MGFMDKMKDSLNVASQDVAKKVSSATESMKMTNQIKINERMIEKIIYQVGMRCYQLHGQEINTEYDDMFQEINRLYIENTQLQQQIESMTAMVKCPNCGRDNTAGAKFCIGCGSSLLVQPAGGIACSNCGAMNAPDAMFCVECGNPIVKANPVPPVPPVPTTPSVPPVPPVPTTLSVPPVPPVSIAQEKMETEVQDVIERQFQTTPYICKNCGKEVDEKYMFCMNCGTPKEV